MTSYGKRKLDLRTRRFNMMHRDNLITFGISFTEIILLVLGRVKKYSPDINKY